MPVPHHPHLWFGDVLRDLLPAVGWWCAAAPAPPPGAVEWRCRARSGTGGLAVSATAGEDFERRRAFWEGPGGLGLAGSGMTTTISKLTGHRAGYVELPQLTFMNKTALLVHPV